jgi:periplasmic mercuric ion binding protein
MKTFFVIAFLVIPFMGFSQQTTKAEFKVYGACGMCETRIENAAKSLDGVASADWKQESQMLTIEYDADKVKLEDVHKKIAEAGHDTELVRAKDEVYQKLPACCHYERPSGDKTGQATKKGGSCCSH